MVKVLVSVFVVALIAVVGYRQFSEQPLDVRDSIEVAVQEAKKSSKLEPANENLLRLQLSIVDYLAKKGHPPDDLSQLVPEYLVSIPVDPNTDKPYSYVRDGKSYQLGEKIAPVVTAKKDGTGAEGEVSAQDQAAVEVAAMAKAANLVGEEGFINPNTLKEDDFVYDSTNKRDPFLPFDLAPKINRDGNISPLEQYSLGQLRLAATLGDPNTGEMLGIVEDASGKGYTVRVGTKIGENGGVIVNVEKDKLKILETKVDFSGVETQNVIELKIHAQENTKAVKKRKAR